MAAQEAKEYGEYYFAFIDILGFKSIVNNSSCDDIYNMFSDVKNHNINYMKAESGYEMRFDKVHYHIMSDSIYVYVSKNEPDAFLAIILTCLHVQSCLLFNYPPILARGAIVCGDLFEKEDIIFGPALVNAYTMESGLAKYPRIIMTLSLYNNGEESLSDDAKSILQGSKLVDIDDDFLCYINFLPKYSNHVKSQERILKLKSFVRDQVNCLTDASVREKYIYVGKKMMESWMADIPSAQ